MSDHEEYTGTSHLYRDNVRNRQTPALPREDEGESSVRDPMHDVLSHCVVDGTPLDMDDLVVSNTTSINENVPDETEWRQTTAKFFNAVNAINNNDKKACLVALISDFILNTTSKSRDYTVPKSWPTGVIASIDDVWVRPDHYTQRAYLRHPVAQSLATGILTNPANRKFVEQVRYKNSYSPDAPRGALFDFVYPATNEYVRKHLGFINAARNGKVRGGARSTPAVYQKPKESSGNAGDRKSSGGEEYFEAPYS